MFVTPLRNFEILLRALKRVQLVLTRGQRVCFFVFVIAGNEDQAQRSLSLRFCPGLSRRILTLALWPCVKKSPVLYVYYCCIIWRCRWSLYASIRLKDASCAEAGGLRRGYTIAFSALNAATIPGNEVTLQKLNRLLRLQEEWEGLYFTSIFLVIAGFGQTFGES